MGVEIGNYVVSRSGRRCLPVFANLSSLFWLARSRKLKRKTRLLNLQPHLTSPNSPNPIQIRMRIGKTYEVAQERININEDSAICNERKNYFSSRWLEWGNFRARGLVTVGQGWRRCQRARGLPIAYGLPAIRTLIIKFKIEGRRDRKLLLHTAW